MRIGFDFDGTLSVWPQGARINYEDPTWTLANSAALLGAVKWVRRILAAGHEIVIITGRDARHASSLSYWLRAFVGQGLPVITRPTHVGLDCTSQAAWKAQAMMDARISLYVGDNLRIDQTAARIAQVQFLDAKLFRDGTLPPIPQRIEPVTEGRKI